MSKNKVTPISVRLSPELKKRLQEHCQRHDLIQNSFIVALIEETLDRVEHDVSDLIIDVKPISD